MGEIKVFSILTDLIFFGKGPDSSWASCKFDEFFLGEWGMDFWQRNKKNWEDPDLFLSRVDFCISPPFICEMSVC
jgi:hypothetical protein